MVNKAKYQVFPYPASRIATIDLGRVASRKHHITGLLEVDITTALTRLKEQGSAKRGVSFFAWIVQVIGAVIGACPQRITYIADKDVFNMEYMFVDPRYQRKGYGHRLLSHVKDVLVQREIAKIGLTTFVDTPAESFHKKAGFRTSRGVINMYTEVENLHL